MYTGYITPAEYADMGYNDIPAEDLQNYLIKASRHIDSLTYNRIVHVGFENLTEFQQEIIKTVICEHAGFLYENKDALNTVLNEYAINGVKMKFGHSINYAYENGVPVEQEVYGLLKQTGLCCRLVVA